MLISQKSVKQKSPRHFVWKRNALGPQSGVLAANSYSFSSLCAFMGITDPVCLGCVKSCLTAKATLELQWLILLCWFLTHTAVHAVGWGKRVRTGSKRFLWASQEVAVITFFTTPWARIWSHGHIAQGERGSWTATSVPCWGSPFPSGYQVLCLKHGGLGLWDPWCFFFF